MQMKTDALQDIHQQLEPLLVHNVQLEATVQRLEQLKLHAQQITIALPALLNRLPALQDKLLLQVPRQWVIAAFVQLETCVLLAQTRSRAPLVTITMVPPQLLLMLASTLRKELTLLRLRNQEEPTVLMESGPSKATLQPPVKIVLKVTTVHQVSKLSAQPESTVRLALLRSRPAQMAKTVQSQEPV